MNYFHSVILIPEKCTGCTVCMHSCPTQAIRVIEGKARIIQDRCIDCGECIKVCPYNAKSAYTDPLSSIDAYEYKVAIPALSFFGQFPENYQKNQILNAIKILGFDHVVDTSRYAEIISVYLKKMLSDSETEKPVITTYCPAVTRLIQINNPELIKNIGKLESPMEIAAREARKEIEKTLGIAKDQIGVFYLAQCPAKITSIKNPLGLSKSALNGAISIKEVYPTLMKNLEKITGENNLETGTVGTLWARPFGQAKVADITKTIAVDGIHQVSKILDMIELGNMKHLDFIETHACRGACLGGPLNVENPFLARYKIDNYARDKKIENKEQILKFISKDDICWDQEIMPKRTLTLDEDLTKAIEKMEKIEEYLTLLPGIDCGACGSPTCRSLAEDVVLGRGKIHDCVFIKKEREE